jgi:lysophospholipase L1-like esterase
VISRLLALVVLLLACSADSAGFGRGGGFTCPRGYIGGGLTPCTLAPYQYAYLEFAPPTGLDMTAECSGTAPAGAKGEALTFSRASAAECYASNGQTLTQVGTNAPRVSSGTATSTWLGLWVEPAATNSILQSRDLSQAAWAKTNMTCTRSAVGMRDDANGASTCTATSANATVCQTITTAAAVRTSSWHLRRRAGSGAVTLSRDGATWGIDAAPSLSPSLWRRAVPFDAPGCSGGNCVLQPILTSSILNPQVCLQLAVSGDSVDVDFVQDEAGDRATTPILTTVAGAARAAEVPTIAHAPIVIASASAVVQLGSLAAGGAVLSDANSGATLTRITVSSDGYTMYGQCLAAVDGAGVTENSSWYLPRTGWAGLSLGCTFGPVLNYFVRGAAYTTASAGNTPAATGTLYVGSDSPGTWQIGGVVKGIRLDTGTVSGLWSGAQTGSGLVAWVGDSISMGFASSAARPPMVLGTSIGKYVQNFGVPGIQSATCLSNWRSFVQGKGYSTIVLLCGVNDLAAGAAAASIYANLNTVYQEALSEGMRVLAVRLTPWAAAGSWSPAKQTQTDALNALIDATSLVVPVNTDSMGTGSPLVLAAAYDSGDGLHPNAAGSTSLAALVQAANP